MLERLDRNIEDMKDDMIKDLQELVKIRSVEESPQQGMPFGEGVDKALKKSLQAADKLDLKYKNVDGYAGHVEIGQGEELIGILCHLDVVPEGDNWKYPPYAAEIHDNKIYGRGTVDDKGPAIAALYALKAVSELDVELNKRVRLILGTDEESGWKGLEYYFKEEEKPALGFSPDAGYPVIHAEKGILIFNLKQSFSELDEEGDIILKNISGGNAPNMVPDYCQATLSASDEERIIEKIKKYIKDKGVEIEVKKKAGEILLISHGVSAHGSQPENGLNAISQLIMLLSELNLPEDELKDFIETYRQKIDMEYNGQSIGCDLEDDVSGRLIFNVGLIDVNRKKASLTVNIRYPVTQDSQTVYEGITGELENSGLVLEKGQHIEPLYVPKDDPLVEKLMDVYKTVTRDDSEPIAIGGGTYARAIEKAVAFGSLFPGQPDMAHQKDECIDIDDLVKNSQIFARAIIALAG